MVRKSTLFSSLIMAAGLCSTPAAAAAFSFTTGSPDGRMGLASRPGAMGVLEIEAADDFILPTATRLNSATFVGLLPAGLALSNINFVGVEIYRVFPLDSVNPPSGNVPTRVNSPSDNAFDSRDTTAGDLAFTTSMLNSLFSSSNSILNGINKSPNQTTGGEGPVQGEEVQFNITFTNPLLLPAGHYFFVPQVGLPANDNFFWLSTAAPPQFTGDLQAWIRNGNLDPDWLRAGTDIVGGNTPPRFNEAFSLAGDPVPEPASITLMLCGLAGLVYKRFRH